MDEQSATHQELGQLVESVQTLQWVCLKNAGDPTAARVYYQLHKPLAELLRFAVNGVLEAMWNNQADPQVQSMSVHVLRVLIEKNDAAKQTVLHCGAMDVLAQGVQQHPADEGLLTGALHVMEGIHGLHALLLAMNNLSSSAAGLRTAMRTFKAAVFDRERWAMVEALPAVDVVRTILTAVEKQGGDEHSVLLDGLTIIGELAHGSSDVRGAFAAAGGWDWILRILEAHMDDPVVQTNGLKALSALARGGSWEVAHSARATSAVERAICRHEQHDEVMQWALWSVQQLNGARALVVPMHQGVFKTPQAAQAALYALGGVSLGQSDGATTEDLPALISAIIHLMNMFSDRVDVILEGTGMLGHAAGFAVATAADPGLLPESRRRLLVSAQEASSAMLQLARARMGDARVAQRACDGLAEVLENCRDDSPVRGLICQALFGQGSGATGSPGGEELLNRLSAAHVSHEKLQASLMQIVGAALGVVSVVRLMRLHCSSHAVQLPAIRTLGLLYGERIELSSSDMECVPEAICAVIDAMVTFKDNLILQQHACYALGAVAEHTTDPRCTGSEMLLQKAVGAATEALDLVRGCCDSRCDSASYNALYLRKEATRCIAALCAVQPSLGLWLRELGVQEVLIDAFKSTADGVWDGRRDTEAEDTLRLELLALSYVLGPLAVLESLRRWGPTKPAVARAVADTVVELARSAMSRRASANVAAGGAAQAAGRAAEADPAAWAALATPVQVLHAAGCGAELQAAMQAHAADEDLQGRLHLAVGFIETPIAQVA